MADPITQKNRLMSLKTPLGEDVLCIERATITESISRPFTMQLDCLADLANKAKVKHDQLIGSDVTLTVELPGKKKRYFNGIVSRFSQGGQDERFAYFRMEVVPWLWKLTLTSDCKIFQDQKVPDILKKVFDEWKEKFPVEDNLRGDFKKLDYCVQYRETDFNFISRLMEEEGIYYFFKHADGKHTLVLSNDISSHPPLPELAQARYLPEAGMGEWEDGVTSWEFRHSLVPGKYVLADHHFQLPAANNEIRPSADGPVKIANNDKLEIFDFPGDYAERFNKPDERLGEVEKHGREIAQWRMEEQAAAHLVISGTSTCRAFSTGFHFTLLGKAGAQIKVPGTQGKYVLTSVKHTIEQSPDYISGAAAHQPYRNTFTCIPAEVPYRPARTTPRPAVQGLQSAVVVGTPGEEIDCDKYGRVKVQFHWDRQGKKDQNSSCWVRVATPWAGRQWGMIHTPRIGHEVLVAFLEGDPDQPVIVGSVYNHDNMPPYKLPDNKTQSGLQSRSSKNGTADNFNAIRFEDKKGSEQIYIHAEKNQDIVVENDETHTVGFEKKDKGDQTIKIFNNQTLEVGTPQSSDGSQTIKIWKDRNATLQMGNDSLTLKMGNQTTRLDLGKSETEALQSIELKVGQSSIKIDQMGVTIKGMMIKIEGQIMTDVKGLITKVNADAMLQVQGAITMIN